MRYIKYSLFLMFLILNVSTSYATTIAVIGTGMDPNNEIVNSKLWKNPREIPMNRIDDDGNGYVDDINGWNFVYDTPFLFMTSSNYCHEPAIMEDMLMYNNKYLLNKTDIEIMIIKTEDWAKEEAKDKEDYLDTVPGILKGIQYAIDNGADIISMSYTLNMEDPERFEQIMLDNPNILFIQCAGNNSKRFTSNKGNSTGKEIANRIVVGAITNKGELAEYSNYGDLVDIYAEGYYVYKDKCTVDPLYFEGTSLAVPKVVSKIIQMMDENEALNISNIKNQLNIDYHKVLYDGPVDRVEFTKKFRN